MSPRRKVSVIGYVGSSGLSSGPHLDYRIQVNGRYVNPRTFQSDSADPLTAAQMPPFTGVVTEFDQSWRLLRESIEVEERDNTSLNRDQEETFLARSADTTSSTP